MGVLDFFGKEAGQRRRRAVNEFGEDIAYYIPPELRQMVGLLADATPSETVGRASQASRRMLDADRTAMQRVGDFGTMASEIAGVVAPAAVAGRAGMPAAQALQESLLGFSASPQGVAARNFVEDEAGAVGPVGVSIDDQVAAARKAVLDSPNDENLFLEYKRLRKMRDEGVSTFPQVEAPAPQASSGLLSDYVGQHRAPMRDDGAPAFNLAGDIYPDDIYSSKAVQYYGTGSDAMDKQTMGVLQSLRGKPDADVTIYRAVPKGVDNINAGDWVTVNKQYAKDHGEGALGGDFDIIERKVKAKDIFTNGDSIHEFGYDPNTPAQEVAGLLSSGRVDEVTDDMLAKLTPNDEMELFDLYQSGATGMDLPMDEASRLARAREMGFDVDKARYHGSERGLSYLDPDMGSGERYRTGVFSTDNPDVADSYVSKSDGTIYPIITRRNDSGSSIDALGANWNKIPPSAPARIAGSALEQEFPELFGDVSTTAYDVAPSLYDDLFNSGASTNALARQKRFEGDSNITFQNLVDRGPAIKRYLGEDQEMQRARELSASQPSEVRVDFYGNQIRSPYARFDPRLAHLRNLSAGAGGLGLLSMGMPQEEQY